MKVLANESNQTRAFAFFPLISHLFELLMNPNICVPEQKKNANGVIPFRRRCRRSPVVAGTPVDPNAQIGDKNRAVENIKIINKINKPS